MFNDVVDFMKLKINQFLAEDAANAQPPGLVITPERFAKAMDAEEILNAIDGLINNEDHDTLEHGHPWRPGAYESVLKLTYELVDLRRKTRAGGWDVALQMLHKFCPAAAKTTIADLSSNPDRWISEMASARRAHEIAIKAAQDDAKAVTDQWETKQAELVDAFNANQETRLRELEEAAAGIPARIMADLLGVPVKGQVTANQVSQIAVGLRYQLAILRGSEDTARREHEGAAFTDLDIVFDGPPGPESGRFVEVETLDGKSVNAGMWMQRPADRERGWWALRMPRAHADGEAVRSAWIDATHAELDKADVIRTVATSTSSERVLSIPERVEILAIDAKRFKADHQGACETMVRLYEVGSGNTPGNGPKRGIVEDVEDNIKALKNELAEAKRTLYDMGIIFGHNLGTEELYKRAHAARDSVDRAERLNAELMELYGILGVSVAAMHENAVKAARAARLSWDMHQRLNGIMGLGGSPSAYTDPAAFAELLVRESKQRNELMAKVRKDLGWSDVADGKVIADLVHMVNITKRAFEIPSYEPGAFTCAVADVGAERHRMESVLGVRSPCPDLDKVAQGRLEAVVENLAGARRGLKRIADFVGWSQRVHDERLISLETTPEEMAYEIIEKIKTTAKQHADEMRQLDDLCATAGCKERDSIGRPGHVNPKTGRVMDGSGHVTKMVIAKARPTTNATPLVIDRARFLDIKVGDLIELINGTGPQWKVESIGRDADVNTVHASHGGGPLTLLHLERYRKAQPRSLRPGVVFRLDGTMEMLEPSPPWKAPQWIVDAAKDAQDLEQLRVQLAGCLTAAEGNGIDEERCAKQGDWGWSLAYQQVLNLRRRYDALLQTTKTGGASSDITGASFEEIGKSPAFKSMVDGHVIRQAFEESAAAATLLAGTPGIQFATATDSVEAQERAKVVVDLDTGRVIKNAYGPHSVTGTMPDSLSIHEQLVNAKEELGRWHRAVTVLTPPLKQHPEIPGLPYALVMRIAEMQDTPDRKQEYINEIRRELDVAGLPSLSAVNGVRELIRRAGVKTTDQARVHSQLLTCGRIARGEQDLPGKDDYGYSKEAADVADLRRSRADVASEVTKLAAEVEQWQDAANHKGYRDAETPAALRARFDSMLGMLDRWRHAALTDAQADTPEQYLAINQRVKRDRDNLTREVSELEARIGKLQPLAERRPVLNITIHGQADVSQKAIADAVSEAIATTIHGETNVTISLAKPEAEFRRVFAEVVGIKIADITPDRVRRYLTDLAAHPAALGARGYAKIFAEFAGCSDLDIDHNTARRILTNAGQTFNSKNMLRIRETLKQHGFGAGLVQQPHNPTDVVCKIIKDHSEALAGLKSITSFESDIKTSIGTVALYAKRGQSYAADLNLIAAALPVGLWRFGDVEIPPPQAEAQDIINRIGKLLSIHEDALKIAKGTVLHAVGKAIPGSMWMTVGKDFAPSPNHIEQEEVVSLVRKMRDQVKEYGDAKVRDRRAAEARRELVQTAIDAGISAAEQGISVTNDPGKIADESQRNQTLALFVGALNRIKATRDQLEASGEIIARDQQTSEGMISDDIQF